MRLLFATLLAFATPLLGQSPPSIVGIHLGDSRQLLDSLLGLPDRMPRGEVYIDGVRVPYALEYSQQGLRLLYSESRGVTLMSLTRRSAGNVDGVRVGDSLSAIIPRWGIPSGGSGAGVSERLAWDRGTWRFIVDSESGIVVQVGIEEWKR